MPLQAQCRQRLNNMSDYVITDKEIEEAEKDILEPRQHFNEQQKIFIKCLAPCYIQAYAGTGKTSAVVGKLHVLAQKGAWNNGRGVCVLSHTNVAVDEIKKHVAKHYPAAMQFPNFVGTIQEFTNHFLFIPYLASHGLQIKYQDNYRYIDYKSEGDKAIIKRIDDYLASKINHSKDRVEARKRFFERLNTICVINNKIFAEDKDGNLAEYTDLQTKKFPQDNVVKYMRSLIDKHHEKGSFLFAESFIYGNEYLSGYTILKHILSQRFQYVFLDEAQDCSAIQLQILNTLFSSGSIFQQIGDVNQAISETIWKPIDPQFLGQSMRFGNNIASFINLFKEEGPGVTGLTERTEKCLIIYDSNKQKEVLPKYAEILNSKNIPQNNGNGFYAISHKHKQLIEYYPEYSEKVAKSTNKTSSYRFEADSDYLDLITEDAVRRSGANYVSRILFNLLYKYYKEGGKARNELSKMLREADKAAEFKKIIVETSKDVLTNKRVSDTNKLRDDLNALLGEVKIDFTRSGYVSKNSSAPVIIPDNIYVTNGISVRIGTIHSVKGQTHDATMLFSNKSDGKQDIQHTFDNTPKDTPYYKKLFYVGSSRAKQLFVFAIEKNAYNNLSDKSCFDDFEVFTI